jgi:hypothetical protein
LAIFYQDEEVGELVPHGRAVISHVGFRFVKSGHPMGDLPDADRAKGSEVNSRTPRFDEQVA